MSVWDFSEEQIFDIAERRATRALVPVHIYGYVKVTEDAAGNLVTDDEPNWILRTDLDNAEQGEPEIGTLWATVEPLPKRWRLTKVSKAGIKEERELIQGLEDRYLDSLEFHRYLPPEEPEPAPREREELPAGPMPSRARLTMIGDDPEAIEETEQIVLAITDILEDEDIQEALAPYMEQAAKDPETGTYYEPPGSPRRGYERTAAVSNILLNWIVAMTKAEGQIDFDGLKTAFLKYLVDVERIGIARLKPEVAAQTLAAASTYMEPTTRTIKGAWRAPTWTAYKPESMHTARWPRPGSPEVKRAAQMAMEFAEELERRQKRKQQEKRLRAKEFVVEKHAGGTVTAGMKKKKRRGGRPPKKKRR